MAGPVANHQILRFGTFELDCANRELRREGVLIKLTPQQWKLLRFLAENPGRVLTREEIQHQIWGNDTFVDFQRNLNVCMAQLRAALNDDSESPRFIQTLPRQGYRFVAPVSSAGAAKPPGEARTRRRRVIALCTATVLCLAGGGYFAFRHTADSQPTRIAVLPFESLGPDAQDDPVLDGMTEELISELGSQSARVNVLGRSSIMRYKGALARRDNAGRELNADYVLEGSVRREGTITRITARLVRVKGQVQVWTNSFEQDGGNTFELEETVAARVTTGVLSNLFSDSKPAVRQAHTPSRAASQAYLNGRYLQHKANLADLRRSVQYFAAATEADPSFAAAQAALAETYVLLARSGAAPPEEFKKARSAAESALRVDASNAEAHNALASAFFWHEWTWPEAEREFRQALTINASFAAAHHDLAFFLVAMGRREAGLSSLRRAIVLDPLSTRVNLDAGWLLLQAHRFDEAIRQAQRALELEPGLEEAHSCISRALECQGRIDPESRRRLRALTEKPDSTEPFMYAAACALLDERQKALQALERAYAARSSMMPLINSEPAFARLHGDDRFESLVKRMKLPY